MNPHYTRTFVALLIALGLLSVIALLSGSFARRAKVRHESVVAAAQASTISGQAQQRRTAELQTAIRPVHAFASAWRNFDHMPEREAAERIRSELETIAQRQLGLVTDGAITPQPERTTCAGLSVRVQRVTLRASGKDLASLLTWVGKVEERFPAALVESCDCTSNVGGNTGLTLRLAQPLTEPMHRQRTALSPVDLASLPELMNAIAWARYLPGVLKATLPIGLQRNPLQPAITPESRSLQVRDDGDEIAPRLESALSGRVRSVIRGAAPLVVIDGRVFRIGDELTIGKRRERPVPEARIKLKHIGDEQLVLRASGGNADRPMQCDVIYPLPAFLRAR